VANSRVLEEALGGGTVGLRRQEALLYEPRGGGRDGAPVLGPVRHDATLHLTMCVKRGRRPRESPCGQAQTRHKAQLSERQNPLISSELCERGFPLMRRSSGKQHAPGEGRFRGCCPPRGGSQRARGRQGLRGTRRPMPGTRRRR